MSNSSECQGGLYLSARTHQYLEGQLFATFGKERVEWALVEFLPQNATMTEFKSWQHKRRDIFFSSFYVLTACAVMVLLELFRQCLNYIIRRKKEHNKLTKPEQMDVEPQHTNVRSSDDTPAKPLLQADTEDVEAQEVGTGTVVSEKKRTEKCTGERAKEPSLRSSSSSLSLGQESPLVPALPEAEAARQRVKGYNDSDLIFVSWHHMYMFMCLFFSGYAFLNQYLSRDFGLDWELYFPWIVYTILHHLVCFAIAARMAVRTRREMPFALLAVASSFNPLDVYFGTLRDAVAAGIYAQYSYAYGDWRPVLLSAVMVVTMFLPNFTIYAQVHPFRDFQENFWPILIKMDRAAAAIADDEKGAMPKEQQSQSFWEKVKACSLQDLKGLGQKYALESLDTSTREHKQAVAWWGDMPQAVAGAVFLVCIVGKDWWHNCYICFVTGTTMLKSIFVWFSRPYILGFMASSGLRWSHLTERDVRRAVRLPFNRTGLSKACRDILRDVETTPPVRVAAMEALQELHKLVDNPEEADQIKDTILWEVAMHDEGTAWNVLQAILGTNQDECGKCGKVVQQLRRLRSNDPGEKKQAAVSLAEKHPEFASAYARDLYKLILSAPVMVSRLQSAEATPTEQSCFACPKGCCWPKSEQGRNNGCTEVAEQERKKDAGKAYVEAFKQAQEVREAAAFALGLLGGGSKVAPVNPDEKVKLEKAVLKVAGTVAHLLHNRDRFVRSAALIAVVSFRGEPAKAAVLEAVKLLQDSKDDVDCCKMAEIALVDLLPHLCDWEEWPKEIRKIAQVRNVSKRVLSRLGGSAAKKLLKELSEEELSVGELKAVLECQQKSAQSMADSNIDGLNLVLGTDNVSICRARELLKKIRTHKGDVKEALNEEHAIKRPNTGAEILPVFITDLEPDDIMFIAEMWKFRREGNELDDPLIIFCVDFKDKDSGEIFETKLLLAALMLGTIKFHILTPKPVKEDTAASKQNIHPLAGHFVEQRESNLKNLARRIKEFGGRAVEYYICAPARGNLGDLVVELGLDGKSNTTVRTVHLYSGSFNVQNMTDGDLNALYLLVDEEHGPLIDLSKFPFFGGNDSVYKNFTDFALPSFSPLLSHKHPLIAAVWTLFNDTFNRGLVHPDKVCQDHLDPTAQEQLQEARLFYENGKTQEYAKKICDSPELSRHIKKKKLPTLRAFACGSCDAPLCDQLLFLRPWALEYAPRMPQLQAKPSASEQMWLCEDKGTWMYNKKDGLTSVDTKGTIGLKALRPVMRQPRDAEALYMMREALETYTLEHLSELYG